MELATAMSLLLVALHSVVEFVCRHRPYFEESEVFSCCGRVGQAGMKSMLAVLPPSSWWCADSFGERRLNGDLPDQRVMRSTNCTVQ